MALGSKKPPKEEAPVELRRFRIRRNHYQAGVFYKKGSVVEWPVEARVPYDWVAVDGKGEPKHRQVHPRVLRRQRTRAAWLAKNGLPPDYDERQAGKATTDGPRTMSEAQGRVAQKPQGAK